MRPTRTTSSTDVPAARTLREIVDLVAGRSVPLAIRAWDGSVDGPPDAEVTVVVRSPDAVRHLLWAPGELGLVRAYVQGHLDFEGDVFSLLSLRDHLGGAGEHVALEARPRAWLEIVRRARRIGAIGLRPPLPPEEARIGGRLGTVVRAARAVGHHYDVGNDFYRLILGPSLTYSCAYWNRPGCTLEDAQAAKYELICRKLDLQPGQRLLDIGCGWGSMAIHAARNHGVRVVGVTLSEEQAKLARRRVAEAGLEDSVEIRLQDYREITDGPFDAISSIGMFEHVPRGQVGTYLESVRSLLRTGGRVVNHAIARPDPTADPQVSPRSFMGRYIFPDATLHEVGTVISASNLAGLEVRDVQSLREHYALTLREWVANLEANWDEAVELVGLGRARAWRLYLAGCAVGFEEYRTSVYQVLAVNTPADGRANLPPTRAQMEVPVEEPVVDLRSTADGHQPAHVGGG
jgi:cyclopropane-fatty-acyl-phospholipid synthase